MIEGGKRISKRALRDEKPLISVITVVKNGEKHLEECIKSVLAQKFRNFEYIILDGGSNDNSQNIIKKYENQIDYFLFENDRGIYDAFNKGMKFVNGNYFGYVNSDDILTPDAFEILSKYITNNPEADFFFGAVKKHWGVLHGYKPWKIKFSWGFYSSHSTGFYIKTESAKLVGEYNLKYKFSADYDYFYRMIVKQKLKGIGTKKDELFGVFRRGGFSSKVNFFEHFGEEIRIRLKNRQSKILIVLIILLKTLKNINKFFK
jgi:glycosyltransferase involved in cell wall biosynthesis